MNRDSRIFVAGHRGLVGSAILRSLQSLGYRHLMVAGHEKLDLTDQAATEKFFETRKPEYVFLAAAKVGGILANDTYPAEFVRDNLAIQTNVIHSSWKNGVKGLLFLGSSCIYPRDCPQPIKEEYLLTGPLEITNRAYAIAKIAGTEMCRAYNRQYGTRFIAVMPTNIFGPGDNYDLETSHVIPGLIRKFHLAKLASHGDVEGIISDERQYGPISSEVKEMIGLAQAEPIAEQTVVKNKPRVVIWGTGSPLREFLYSDDLAEACVFVMNRWEDAPSPVTGSRQEKDSHLSMPLLNIGSGKEITISQLAEKIKKVVGFEGDLVFDSTKPDGTPRKLLDISRIRALGWEPRICLQRGLELAYADYLAGPKQGTRH